MTNRWKQHLRRFAEQGRAVEVSARFWSWRICSQGSLDIHQASYARVIIQKDVENPWFPVWILLSTVHSWWIFYTSVDVLLVAGKKYAPPRVYVTHDYSRYSPQKNHPSPVGLPRTKAQKTAGKTPMAGKFVENNEDWKRGRILMAHVS